MWLYLFHQFLGVEVLIMLLPVIVLKSFSGLSLLGLIPLLIFIAIKFYCWLAMIALFKAEKVEEQKIIFGKQWIINSLMSMPPSVRLTIPETTETTATTSPYQQL
jgi:hypothetical protein